VSVLGHNGNEEHPSPSTTTTSTTSSSSPLPLQDDDDHHHHHMTLLPPPSTHAFAEMVVDHDAERKMVVMQQLMNMTPEEREEYR